MALTTLSSPDSALTEEGSVAAASEQTRVAASARRRFVTVLRSPIGICAVAALIVVAFFAVFGPVLWGDVARQADLTQLSAKPSAHHLLGTDAGGRDVLARVLTATRLSIVTAVLAAALGVSVGVVIGLLPTIAPRRLGRLINSALGVALAFPALLLAIVVSITLGVGSVSVTLAIGLAMAPSFARLAQTLGASVTGRDFVAAARILGVSRPRILVRHVLPNVRDPLIVNASIGAGTALVAATGLSFLGLGVQAPEYDWGRMLNESVGSIYVNPAPALGLGAAIVLAGVMFALVGEVLARAFGLHRPSGRRRRRQTTHSAAASPVLHVADTPVLSVRDLRVEAPQERGWATPVRGVSFDIGRGEIVGIVGESGSGKSLTCMAVASLLEEPLHVAASSIRFEETELVVEGKLPGGQRSKALAHQLGTRLAFVFQDPSTSLNPALHVGTQVAEVGVLHGGLKRREAFHRAVDRLAAVRLSDPARRARQYPHELSGGMRQRAMIAMGLMVEPALVIADEPTTALDVTVQREVLALLRKVNREHRTAVMFVSHDISLVSSFCTRVLVMYRGAIVESLSTEDLAAGRAEHPYTRALVAAVPHMDAVPGTEFATITEDTEFPLDAVEEEPV
ncbi:dipeptide/oligopeptide/nickel ABC transporter permease/ATP-binding protein [Streptomyces sp. DASNCL29]|uniref:dipeptide/oligopeptide/nickel ABC transporter permease/ATP-binding protein n=1 Tax=Streptomyces sp. DASNCL29 TaxID=2583819 RepID=UPI00110FBC17|nr:dipeptide/oligopeptide/nickel ABC transporter permease/ATP-binding protein [Streptomyces sp. DASNCL29]TMU98402.1 dipeptide/oligopeptide/nickel ABC transporter permease/ATP-binding protein [Streptomyces sp. DASNCL29]